MPRNPQVDRLVALLRAAGEAAAPCPSNADLSHAMGLSETAVADLLRSARHAGLIELLPAGVNKRIVAAADGSWRTAATRVGGGKQAAAAPQIPERRCSRCRNPFRPKSPYLFRCDGCRKLGAGEAA